MDVLILGLWVLALARVTRLLIRDRLTEFLRVWAVRISKENEHGLAVYFSTCPWCVGMWVALASAPYVIWLTEWSWWLYPLIAFAGSYVVGVFAERIESDEDPEIEIITD